MTMPQTVAWWSTSMHGGARQCMVEHVNAWWSTSTHGGARQCPSRAGVACRPSFYRASNAALRQAKALSQG